MDDRYVCKLCGKDLESAVDQLGEEALFFHLAVHYKNMLNNLHEIMMVLAAMEALAPPGQVQNGIKRIRRLMTESAENPQV